MCMLFESICNSEWLYSKVKKCSCRKQLKKKKPSFLITSVIIPHKSLVSLKNGTLIYLFILNIQHVTHEVINFQQIFVE